MESWLCLTAWTQGTCSHPAAAQPKKDFRSISNAPPQPTACAKLKTASYKTRAIGCTTFSNVLAHSKSFYVHLRVHAQVTLLEICPRFRIRKLLQVTCARIITSHTPSAKKIVPLKHGIQPELSHCTYPNHIQFFVSLHKLFFQFHNLCHGFILCILEFFR